MLLNIFLYVVRIGIDQWSTVYAFQELKLSKEVAIQGFTLFEVGALVGTLLWAGCRIWPTAAARWWPASRWR